MLASKNLRQVIILYWLSHCLIVCHQTKKKRPSRRAPADAELGEDGMDVDGPAAPIIRDLDANFVDDDELQAALARSRQAKLRKMKKVSPEELARRSENHHHLFLELMD